jgi:hypothetical protein
LGASDTPYICYADTGLGYKGIVQKFNGAYWQPVGPAMPSLGQTTFITMAAATDGTLYTAYNDMGAGSKLHVMKYDGSNWASLGSPALSASGVYEAALAIGPDGTPYVAYSDSAYAWKLSVLKYTGGAWAPVGSIGFSPFDAVSLTLAVPHTDKIYAAFARDIDNGYESNVMIPGPLVAVQQVNNIASTTLTISPNPTTGTLHITLTSPINEPAHITITNILGETIQQYTTTTNKETPARLNAPPGLYFITATNTTGTQSAKVIVK